MLDETLRPHLIEINTNPAIFTDTKVQKDIIPKLVDDTIKLALELHPLGQEDGATQVKEFMLLSEGNEGSFAGLQGLQLPYNVIYADI